MKHVEQQEEKKEYVGKALSTYCNSKKKHTTNTYLVT